MHYSKFLSDRGGGGREGGASEGIIEFWDKLLKVGLNLCYFMRWACWMENYKWDCKNGRVNGNKLVKVEVILDYFMRLTFLNGGKLGVELQWGGVGWGFSYHILLSVFCYWTDTHQVGIYLLNGNLLPLTQTTMSLFYFYWLIMNCTRENF